MYRRDEEYRIPEPEVVELALLLPSWQAKALESAARCRGLTTAQMLRRLIGDLVTAPTAPVEPAAALEAVHPFSLQ
jgi:hypothetical protein